MTLHGIRWFCTLTVVGLTVFLVTACDDDDECGQLDLDCLCDYTNCYDVCRTRGRDNGWCYADEETGHGRGDGYCACGDLK